MVSPLPAGAVIDTRTGAPSPNLPPVLATMPGEYALVLHRDGAVTGVRVVTSARVHGLDEAFTRAFERIDDPPSGAVGPVYPSNLTDDSLPLRVRFTVGRESAAAAVPLSVRFVPITRLDRQPQLAAGNPKPSYPHIRSRVTDTVLVQFAVERTGRIDMETVRPIRAFAQVFLDPVLAILPKLRFEPALAGGCPTRTVIVQPFIIQPPAT